MYIASFQNQVSNYELQPGELVSQGLRKFIVWPNLGSLRLNAQKAYS